MLILSKGKKRKKLKAFIYIRYMGATFISSERCRNIFITRCLFYKISIFEIAKKSKSKLLNGLCRICKAERHQKNCWMGYENISLFSNLVVFISFLYFFIYTKKYQNPSVDLVGRHERVLFIFFFLPPASYCLRIDNLRVSSFWKYTGEEPSFVPCKTVL